ncbi:hypothetical protein QTP88_005347 [Uroleucon formosanum]
MDENLRKACIAIILALSIPSKRIANRNKRKKYCHLNLLKEIQLSDPKNYQNYFRMNINIYNKLLSMVEPLIIKKDTNMRESILPNQRLALTLRYLATGRSFEDLKYSVVIAPTTISEIVMETCKAIITVLKDCIQLPQTTEQWKSIGNDFGCKWNFENCIGSIDDKHVNIKNLKILVLHIIIIKAFSLQTYLMKPYSQHDLTSKRRIFNYRLLRARRVVENAFGILASRFGVFQKPINLEPDKASTITLACCYLHNFLIENNKHLYVSKNVLITENLGTGKLQIGDEITENVLTPLQRNPVRNKSANAKIVREKYCDYFCEEDTPIGLAKYEAIFHDLNLSIIKPKNDICNKCDTFHMRISLADGDEKENLQTAFRDHLEQADMEYTSRAEYKEAKTDEKKY